jgi:hypothetical protein
MYAFKKIYYMSWKDFWKKDWQQTHIVVILLLVADFLLVTLFGRTWLFFVRLLRPVLIVLRSREVRRVYTVAKDMIPML